MRDLRSVVAFGFDDNFSQKKEKMGQLLFRNRRDQAGLNIHSTLKMAEHGLDCPEGEISVGNGLIQSLQLFQKTPLYSKKVG